MAIPIARAACWALVTAACTTSAVQPARRPPLQQPVPREEPSDSAVVGFRYHPASGGPYSYYRLDSIEYRLPTGAQFQVQGRTMFLHVRIEPADTLYLVEFRLDSISQDPGTTRQPALDSLGMVRWTAEMGLAGGLGRFQVSPTSPFGERLSGELARRFFPAQPTGGVEPGAAWNDSTEIVVRGLSVNQTDRVESRSTAVASGPGDSAGVRVETKAVLERRGSSTQTGELIEEVGEGEDSTASYIDPQGRFIRSEGREIFDLVFTVPAVGQKVPVRQLSRYRVVRLQSTTDRGAAAPTGPDARP